MSGSRRALYLLSGFVLLGGLDHSVAVATQESSPAPAVFRWPDPHLDFTDEILYGGRIVSLLAQGCLPRDNTSIAAQWVRLAYHDMATHDVNDGSGGLDASIRFELDRAQNVGQGMLQSLIDFNLDYSPYVSFADTMAMGTVLAVAGCGGPIIPYRGGRIDATVAGPATVPEPQQDLQSHIASFKRQGFTQTEMIGLVACGHTLGGVRGVDFPTILNSTSDRVTPFDSTPARATPFDTNLQFDNLVVTEYLDGTTLNPLVVTANVSTRSDLRIFSSDGNVTVQNLASSTAFNETCGNLLERMINTVPKEVTLTAPVEPLENKARGFSFYTNNGSYVLSVSLRRITTDSQPTVTLFWNKRDGPASACLQSGCSANATSVLPTPINSFLGSLKYGIQGFTEYSFIAQAPLDNSISKFWFVVDEQDGSNPTVIDNYGDGYEIPQDTVLYDPMRTQIINISTESSIYALVVAVRTNNGKDATVSVESWQPGAPNFVPIIDTVELQLDSRNPPADGYTFFTGNISTSVTAIHISALVGGQEFKLYKESDVFVVS